MSRRIGRWTVELPARPGIIGWSSVVGAKEGMGPYGKLFDRVMTDELDGKASFEAAERGMLEQAAAGCATMAGEKPDGVHMFLAGDLLNQIISAGYAARNLGIPFYGLYGACSTMAESLSLGGMLADGGYAERLICATSSHFCTAERQYRAPLELGGQRPPTAQWTVTGAGAVFLSGGEKKKNTRIVLTHATCGRVIDLGVTDANNMGAAMAPAAADTILAHMADLGRRAQDYDLIVTGDLGSLGKELLLALLKEKGVEITGDRLFDCGCEIYSDDQGVNCGGSGCGCSASMLCGFLLPELAAGRLKRILFVATGALMSTTSSMQGESIPGIAHAVVLEYADGGE